MAEEKIQKTEEEWKKELSPEQYRVLRKKETERPFSGEYDSVFDPGTYTCGACGAELFSSEHKYNAGCGWPSFDDAMPGAVEYHEDTSHGMTRTEVTCARCGGHLGHLFDDGPKSLPSGGPATGKRFCINSVSLKKK